MLKIDNLKKVYEDGTVALDNISLEIKDNEFVALLGPSGCGKSTTLNIIAGLLDVTEGDIYYNQTKLTDLKPRERDMGMVFQSYALYPHMTVLDNIAFPLKQKGMKKKERYRIAKEYVEQFH